ncbi:hypothetical protein KCX82_03250 [Clostridiales bacterium BAD-6]|jgi:uncharacterized YkwD family protein|uniref:SCP domain-containing protein n=2 Tax=Sinanaerobacter chloroacetimidivorans TaxID=2818044 RepID=A0A8J7VY42_9FIRM|nr:hypothetical protein [Sinanaerobacter chloroacetimidivorans]
MSYFNFINYDDSFYMIWRMFMKKQFMKMTLAAAFMLLMAVPAHALTLDSVLGNQSENTANTAVSAPSTEGVGSYEQQVIDLVNKERAAAGLPALTLNTKLAGVAEKKAEDLRDKNYFSHTSPTYGSPFDMMKQFGITYKAAGENIARGQQTPSAVMNGWMNSQAHKNNILNKNFTQIGVGYVTDSNGGTYWVQMFIRP